MEEIKKSLQEYVREKNGDFDNHVLLNKFKDLRNMVEYFELNPEDAEC